MTGFIYVASNPSLPGLYKIGSTERSPSLRVSELSKSTSCPSDFNLEYYAEVNNHKKVEQEIGRILEAYRPNAYREFFTIEPGDFYAWLTECDIIITDWCGCDVAWSLTENKQKIPEGLPLDRLAKYRI